MDKRHPFSEEEITRFWARVQRGTGCWLWVAGCFAHGYGAFIFQDRRPGLAHRFSYELHHGPIPEGAVVMHTCDNRRCVNPAHLRAGSQRENIHDAMHKDRWMTPARLAHLDRVREWRGKWNDPTPSGDEWRRANRKGNAGTS